MARDVEYLTSRGEWQWQVYLTGRAPAGRLLTVACEIDAATGRFRPVTMWEASPTEAAHYREEFPDD